MASATCPHLAAPPPLAVTAARRRGVGNGGAPGPAPVGFNTYWLMYFAADHATRAAVTAALAEAADAGGLNALDFVMSEARKHNARLPHSVEDLHLLFVKTWMQQHIDDAANLLGMPILIGEFGVSLQDGKFSNEFREAFMETVYSIFLSSWKGGVIGGGCLVWQLFPESAEHMDDGYAVIFAKSPSILNLLYLPQKKNIELIGKSLEEPVILRICCCLHSCFITYPCCNFI
ncbi:hypothetical protein PR202_gb00714 [Eleusine coracana subsp. coracana]|uniref:Mannan endo-1,4-beta-mannosidase n=1 Tax=Eleusine coracana subsp. coracana TaxID=191504 RepID=A0AAV5DUE2_ELECO|nr:hypothetical protein PR202_gb00714 [Eleusine coracana subsp. coracana]